MDNVAHTLVGAALGRVVADRRLRYAPLVGAVAANAPDWAELFIGLPAPEPVYLTLHRGITHAFAGAAVEIVELTLAAWAVYRIIGGGRLSGLPLPRSLLLVITVAVLSHLYMDWQGSYGLRPLLPWSDRWYYGDFVAIVDVFFWIVPLIGLAWGAERHWRPAALFGLALLAATGVTVGTGIVAGWVKVTAVVLLAVALVGWIRFWFGPVARRAAAAAALAALGAYAFAQAAASLPVKAAVREQARQRFGPEAEWAALTVVGRPFSWEPVWAGTDSVAGRTWRMARRLDHPLVRRALATPDGRAMTHFARFLVADIDSSDGTTVFLRDARYWRAPGQDWGEIAVRLTASPPSPDRSGGARPGDGEGSGSGAPH